MTSKTHPFDRLPSQYLYVKPHVFKQGGKWYKADVPGDTPGLHVRTGNWLRKFNHGTETVTAAPVTVQAARDYRREQRSRLAQQRYGQHKGGR